MDHTNLAQRFNEATDALGPLGHGVLVNRARQLLGDGDVAGVVGFLRDAGRRQGLPVLGKLAGAVEDWQTAGGRSADLTRLPAWKQGRERGEAVATRLGELTSNAGLDALIETLVAEQRTQAALPDTGERLTGPRPLANIFGGEKHAPTAVVEADSHLVPVPLNLDDEPVRPPLPRSPSRPVRAVAAEEPKARTVGDRPTSAPPVPLTTSTAPPARRPANTASVPLAPEAVEEGPTMVNEPVFEDEVVEAAAMVRSAPKVPAVQAPPPPTQLTTPTPPQVPAADAGGSGAAYWIAFGLLLVVAVLYLVLR